MFNVFEIEFSDDVCICVENDEEIGICLSVFVRM